MPSDLTFNFESGDIIEADHVNQFGLPIQRLERGQTWYGPATHSGTTSDDYAVTINQEGVDDELSPFTVILEPGLLVHFKVDVANTTSTVTLNVNGQGAKAVKKNVDEDPAPGELQANQMISALYDGDNFQLIAGVGSANVSSDRLLGRDTSGTGAVEELTVNGGLEFTGTGGIQRSALTGDVTANTGASMTTIATSAVTTAKLNDGAVTYAKIQNVSATDKLLGRSTAGAGAVEEIPCTGAGRALLAATSAADQRSALALGTAATSNSSDFALLAGRSGGQSLIGGTAASENLTLRSTSNATQGQVRFGAAGTTVFDEANSRVGIGTSSPSAPLHVINATGPQLILGQATTPRLEISVDSSGGTVLSFAGSAPYMTINKPVGFNQASPGVDLFSTLGWSRAAALQDGHAFVFKNSGTPWALGATGGVLYFMTSTADSAAGTGTYQGNWSTNGLAIGMGGSFSNRKLEVRSTTTQQRWSYDGSNYAEMTVASDGKMTLTNTGSQVGIGNGVNPSGTQATAMGYSSQATGTNATAVGASASASGNYSVALGTSANAAGLASVAIGSSASASGANEFVCGATGAEINNVYFGGGKTAASPSGWSLNATGGSGTNIAGGSLTVAGGKATGNAVGGSVKVQTSTAGSSGSTLQSLATVAEFGPAKIGLYGVTPVVRASAYTQTYSTAVRTVPAALTDSTTGTPGTTLNDVGAAFSRSTLNNNFATLNARLLEAMKLINSLIDDSQAIGIAQ